MWEIIDSYNGTPSDVLKVFGKEDFDEELLEQMRQNLDKRTVLKTWDYLIQEDKMKRAKR